MEEINDYIAYINTELISASDYLRSGCKNKLFRKLAKEKVKESRKLYKVVLKKVHKFTTPPAEIISELDIIRAKITKIEQLT